MITSEIKKYICVNNKIPFILEKLHCHHIKDWPNRVGAANPDGDNANAIQVYKNENLNVIDYTRDLSKIDASPDIFTLVQYLRQVDFRDAFVWLHQILNLKVTYTTQKPQEESPLSIFKSLNRKYGCKTETKVYNDEILDDYFDYPYIDFALSAKLTNQTVKKFHIGYSYAERRTILPVKLWSSGELIGIRGRSAVQDCDILGIPKYFPLVPFPTGSHIYGLWENYQNIQNSSKVIVFEGEKSVLTMDSLQTIIQHEANENIYGVSLFGHELSDEQCRILAGLNLKEIIFAFDKDMPERISWKACEKLYNIRNVSYIYDNFDLLSGTDAPIDKGISTLLFLYNNRIPYDEMKHQNYIHPMLGEKG